MKTRFILLTMCSLLISSVVGPALAHGMDLHLVVNSFDAAPLIATSVSFGLSFLPLMPAGVLGVYVNTNVVKPGANKGLGGNKKYNITFFDYDNVDLTTWPARDDKGIVITGNISFLSAAYMITVYGTVDTIKNTSESSGELDAEGILQSVIFNHPGNENEIREFRTNWLSRNIGIIVERCSDSKKDLYGSPCAPLRMVFKHDEDKDKNVTEFTLKSSNKGPDVADYQGTLTYDTVTDTVIADATEVDLAEGEGRYQLTTGSAAPVAIATVSNAAAMVGKVFTLLGSGGAHPSTIPAGAVFSLANGTTWTALTGATITFKVFKNGASTYLAVEQSRS
jgi:hypothetical protein